MYVEMGSGKRNVYLLWLSRVVYILFSSECELHHYVASKNEHFITRWHCGVILIYSLKTQAHVNTGIDYVCYAALVDLALVMGAISK